jgi:hypothetical protein
VAHADSGKLPIVIRDRTDAAQLFDIGWHPISNKELENSHFTTS